MILQNLSVKDLNNVHLTCSNLHQIANLHVNPKLCFSQNSPEDMQSLVQCSRIFQELILGFDGYLEPEKFEVLEEFISFTGAHVKKLTIGCYEGMRFKRTILSRLIQLLPNLKFLEMDRSNFVPNEKSVKWDFKPTKIEYVKFIDCFESAERLLGSLDKCVIKEAEVRYSLISPSPKILRPFLKSQEKNLKKLTINCLLDLLAEFKDLRLEYLNVYWAEFQSNSLEFWKHQENLKFLTFQFFNYPDEFLNPIFEAKNLETLEILREDSRHHIFRVTDGASDLNNIHKLQKLKRLKVSGMVSKNILNHLKFGIFGNLEELEAELYGASVEAVKELKRIAPNLKKIVMTTRCPSTTINALLESLENLEWMRFYCGTWEMAENIKFVCAKLKHIFASCDYNSNISAELFTKVLPNLEFLHINLLEITESSLVTMLSRMKLLKKLQLRAKVDLKFDSEFALGCIRGFGRNVEELEIDAEYGRYKYQCKSVAGFDIKECPGKSRY
jgi:hypothetical protein